MTRRIMLASLFALSFAAPAFAQDTSYRPDDAIAFDLSAEDWVTTKTAHVTLDVEAAVTATSAGTMRSDMIKAVGDAAKGDWRLVNFNRSQDQTGMERWSATFDARLPENELSGLADSAKKASKAGMQVVVGNVDFSPTLEETEAVRANLRAHIIKEANDQLTALNTTLPGRSYRIAQIDFGGDASGGGVQFQSRVMRKPMMMSAMAVSSDAAAAPALERSEKITLGAHVVYAAVPPAAATH